MNKYLFHLAALLFVSTGWALPLKANITGDGSRLWEIEIVHNDTKQTVLRDTLADNAFLLSGLQPGAAYFARVRTKTVVYSDWTASDVFVTSPATRIDAPAGGSFRIVSADGGSIVITTDRQETVCLYTPDGRPVRTVALAKGENVLSGLKRGLYLVNHLKTIVK
jgi:hypothetical protein